MSNRVMITVGILSGWMIAFVMFFYQDNFNAMARETQRLLDSTSLSIASNQISIEDKASQPHVQVSSIKNPIPNDKVLEGMSEGALELLFHRYISGTQTTCSMVERMGKLTDGGWEVCLDERYAPDPKNCLVYSFGINYAYSFDDDMAAYGCEVHSFDPSMTKSVDHLRGERIHFHLEGVADKDIPKPEPGKWKLFTIGTFRERLSHRVGERRIDVMKMDVEGAERTSLPQALKAGSFADIPQICFELHHQRNKHFYLINLAVLRECYAGGLRIFHTNRNFNCPFKSSHTGKTRTQCHEVYMVNVTLAKKTMDDTTSLSVL